MGKITKSYRREGYRHHATKRLEQRTDIEDGRTKHTRQYIQQIQSGRATCVHRTSRKRGTFRVWLDDGGIAYAVYDGKMHEIVTYLAEYMVINYIRREEGEAGVQRFLEHCQYEDSRRAQELADKVARE